MTLIATSRLPAWFAGEARIGDLTDPAYRHDVVLDADVAERRAGDFAWPELSQA